MEDNGGQLSEHDEESDCDSCVAGRSSDVVAATTVSVCQICPEGTSSAAADDSCSDCVRGKYNENEGASSCVNCGVGFFLDAIGSLSQYDCASCGQGTYNNAPSSALCTPCEVGHYASGTGSISCEVSCTSKGEQVDARAPFCFLYDSRSYPTVIS